MIELHLKTGIQPFYCKSYYVKIVKLLYVNY